MEGLYGVKPGMSNVHKTKTPQIASKLTLSQGQVPSSFGGKWSIHMASLVAQMVKNPPAMWVIQVLSMGQEDPLEKGKATHSNILAWRSPMDRGA